MCNAGMVFCINQNCFGLIGWYILRPCLPAHLAGCMEGYCVFNDSQLDWSTYRHGCRRPRTETRERSGYQQCTKCFKMAMDNTMASANEGVGKGLLERRIQQAASQGRDLSGGEAAVNGSTSVASDLRDTPDDELDTQSDFADAPGSPAGQLFAGSAVDSGTEVAETQEHAPGTALADGLHGPEQPSLQEAAMTSGPKARASDDPTSPSYYLDAEDIPSSLITPVQPTQADDPAASPAYYPLVGFQEGEADEISLPLGTGYFVIDGDVLDQSAEFWDIIVGPADEGNLAYVFGQTEDLPGAKRQHSEDADEAEASPRGSKMQHTSRG